jgi:hypothetical protein
MFFAGSVNDRMMRTGVAWTKFREYLRKIGRYE